MDISLFKNNKYQEIIKKYAKRTKFEVTRAFDNYDEIDYKRIIKQCPTIDKIHFFCYLQQSWFGYLMIADKYYIIEVDDECTIQIVSDNEVGWMEGPLWIYDDHDDRLKSLQLEMNQEFNTSMNKNDYELFQKVMDSHPEWFR